MPLPDAAALFPDVPAGGHAPPSADALFPDAPQSETFDQMMRRRIETRLANQIPTVAATLGVMASEAASGGLSTPASVGIAGLSGAVGDLAKRKLLQFEGYEPKAPLGDLARSAAIEGAKQGAYDLGGRAIFGTLGKYGEILNEPVTKLINEASTKFNLPLTWAERTGRGKTLQFVADRAPFGATLASKSKEKFWFNTLTGVEKSLDQIANHVGAEAGGATIKEGLTAARKVFTDAAEVVYGGVDQSVGNAVVRMDGPSRVIQKMTSENADLFAKYPRIMQYSRPEAGIMKDFATRRVETPASSLVSETGEPIRLATSESVPPPPLTFSDAHRLQSRLGEIAYDAKVSGNSRLASIAGSARKSVRDAMDTAAKNISPEAGNLYKRATEFYRNGMETFDSKIIQRMMKADPEKVVASVNIGDVTALKTVKKALLGYGKNKYGFNQFRRLWAEKRLLGGENVPETIEGSSRPYESAYSILSRLPARMEKVNETMRAEMFDDSPGKSAWRNLRMLASAAGRMKPFNPSESAAGIHAFRVLEGVIDTVVAAGTRSIMATGAIIAAPEILSAVIHNDALTRRMVATLSTPSASREAMSKNLFRIVDLAYGDALIHKDLYQERGGIKNRIAELAKKAAASSSW